MELHHTPDIAFPEKLNIFKPPVYQNQIISSAWETIERVDVANSGKLSFHIKGNSHMIDLPHTLLCLTLKITKDTGANIDANSEVAPSNYIGGTMFNQLKVFLGDQILDVENSYNDAALLQAEYTLPKGSKEGWLSSFAYHRDTPGKHDVITDDNLGYKKRKELFANSKSVVVYAKVHSGIFNINRTLINNLDMSLEFAIDKNVKNLMCAENSTFKLVVEKASLKIRRIRISEELSVKIDRLLSTKPAVYNIPRGKVTVHTIPASSRDFQLSNFNSLAGELPSRIFIALQGTDRYSGAFHLNSYMYEDFEMVSHDILVDGRSVYGGAIETNFTTAAKEYNSLYMQTLQALGSFGGVYSTDISYDEFSQGYLFFGADLTATYGDGGISYLDPILNGNLQLNLKFAKALAAAVNVIIYCDYLNSFEIDVNRKLVKNFT